MISLANPSLVVLLAGAVLLLRLAVSLTAPTAPHGASIVQRAQALPPVAPRPPNLIYWAQRKTGSQATRSFLETLAQRAGLDYRWNGASLFPRVQDYAGRVHNRNCTIFAGHILIADVRTRRHEAESGAVITTTRSAFENLISKYYHKTKRYFLSDLPLLNDTSAEPAKVWYLIWLEYDACEPLRYYDGIHGCEVDEADLKVRAAAIANRMDCVIDIEDSDPDTKALCRAMGVRDCPSIVRSNKRRGYNQYDEVLAIPHIRRTLERPAHVLQILRDALLKRRCRDVLRGGASGKQSVVGGLPPARWPTPSCKEELGWS